MPDTKERMIRMDAAPVDAFNRCMDALVNGRPIPKDNIQMALPVAREVDKTIDEHGLKIIEGKEPTDSHTCNTKTNG